MLRYLALVGEPGDPTLIEAMRSYTALLAVNAADWSTAYSGPGALVLYKSTMPEAMERHVLQDGGVVLGALFERHEGDDHVVMKGGFTAEDSKRILVTQGRALIERYFGAYVAFLYDRTRGCGHVFREPMGNVPCYRTARDGIQVFFSHVEDCVRCLHLEFEIDPARLTRWLVFAGVLSTDCSLKHVENVLAGERLTIARGHIARDRLWSARFFASQSHAGGPAQAARLLRRTVQGAVNAWAARYANIGPNSNIAVKLSGGLDSAIVTACVAHAPSAPKVTCLNFTAGALGEQMHFPGVPDKEQARVRAVTEPGDERAFARLVAQRWGMPLIEHQRNRAMDLHALSLAPLSVDPAVYFTAMDVDEIEVALAAEGGTQAFFSGQHGDEVFMSTRRPFAPIDFAFEHGLRSDLLTHVLNAARTSHRSFWSVLKQSLWNGALKRPYRHGADCLSWPSLLPAETLNALTAEDFASPFAWMLSGLPPGKQFHAMAAGAAAYHRFIFKAGHLADYVDPLNSQPVWEQVLQFWTYDLALNGESRGLARQAFADMLPEQIRRRQVKGVGTAFYQDVVNRNRNYLKDRLLQGWLVRDGYLDRRRVEHCLSAEYPSATHTASTILAYLSAEIWMQRWMEQWIEVRRTRTASETASAV